VGRGLQTSGGGEAGPCTTLDDGSRRQWMHVIDERRDRVEESRSEV